MTRKRLLQPTIGAAALAAVALGGSAFAGAASAASGPPSPASAASPSAGAAAAPLTGLGSAMAPIPRHDGLLHDPRLTDHERYVRHHQRLASEG